MAVFQRPDGKYVEVPETSAQQALAKGYKAVSREQADAATSTGSLLRTGVESAVRGLTMGFGEPIMQEFQAGQYDAALAGGADAAAAESLRARREANPATAMTGEIAGLVAPSLLAPEVTVPRIAQRLGVGATKGIMLEGGLMGLGQLVSDSTIEQTPLDVEKLAVGVGMGALTAGAVGKSFEALGKGVSWGTQKTGGKHLKTYLKEAADNVEATFLGVQKHEMRDSMLKLAREEGIAGGRMTLDSAASKASEVAERVGKEIGEGMVALEQYVPLNTPGVREALVKQVRQHISSKFGKSFAHRNAQGVGDEVAGWLADPKRTGTWGDAWNAQSGLWKEGNINTAMEEVREEVRQAIRNFAFNEVGSGKRFGDNLVKGARGTPRAKAAREAIPVPSATVRLGDSVEGAGGAGGLVLEGGTLVGGGGARRGVPGVVQNAAQPHTIRLGGDVAETSAGGIFDFSVPTSTPVGFGDKLRELGQQYSAAKTLQKSLEKRLVDSKTGLPGISTWGVGALAGLATNPAGAIAGGLLADQVKKRGGFIAGSVMRNVADSQVLQGVARKLTDRVKHVLGTSPDAFGAARMAFEKALLKGESAVLDEYLRAATSEADGRTMAVLGLAPETPDEVESAGGRLSALAALKAGSNGVDDAINEGVEGFLTGKGAGRVREVSPSIKDFLAKSKQLQELVADPTMTYEKLPPEILDGAPALAAQLFAQGVKAARFLDEKAPKNPYLSLPQSIRPAWQPSAADLGKWGRYAEAVEEPLRVLKRMAEGQFNQEHAEALQKVYPELYADMQQRIYERLSVWEKPVPYEKRLMLAQLFGSKVLGISPAQVGVMQATFPKDEDAPQSKGGTRPDGRQTIDAAKNAMTQAQRLEARGAGKP